MGVPRESIMAQVDRIQAHKKFFRSPALCRFLRFAIEEAIEGRGNSLKEYSVGIRVFERNESFDPRLDPIVRVQARNLRSRLRAYYDTDGASDPVLIEFPKGGYVPAVQWREQHTTPEALATSGRRWRWSAVAIALLTVTLFVSEWLHGRSESDGSRLTLSLLTNDAGATLDPALSKDGKLLAYSSDRGEDGIRHIWVQSVKLAEPRQLTHHEAADITPDFAPDGTSIVFRSFRDGGGIYVVPLAGGEERKVADGGFSPRFSPDGAWIAYSAIDDAGNSSLRLVPASGGEARKIQCAASIARCPIWTPDGKHLLFVGALPGTDDFDWWVVPVAPSITKTVTAIQTGASKLQRRGWPRFNPESCPADWLGDQVLFTAMGDAEGVLRQVQISQDTWKASGKASQMFVGANMQLARVWAGPGQRPRLVFTRLNSWAHIFSLPVDADRGKTLGALQQLTRDNSLSPGLNGTIPRLSMDGKKLVFASPRTGNYDVWLKDLQTGEEQNLSPDRLKKTSPVISADGTRVAYMVEESGGQAIYVEGAGPQRRPQRVCENCGAPQDWSVDGRTILYFQGGALWRLDLTNGSRALLLEKNKKHEPMQVALSPGGKWLALVTGTAGIDHLRGFVVPFDGALADEAKWILVTEEAYRLSLHWAPAGHLLYFFSLRDGRRCLWAQRLSNSSHPLGTPFPVQHFHKDQRYPWGGSWISPARDKLAINLTETLSNLWIAELTDAR